MDNDNKKPLILSASGQKDSDSGLMLFRGMVTPWDEIKSFPETYKFFLSHTGTFTMCFCNALDILEPDEVKKMDLLQDASNSRNEVSFSLTDPKDDRIGIVKAKREEEAIPPFMDGSLYPTATIVDMFDERLGISGYTIYCSDDRVEKEMYQCPFAICGVDICDVSIGGSAYSVPCWGREETNMYLMQRLGDGDPCCHICYESKKKYGETKNPPDDKFWEQWGPPAAGLRPNKDMLKKGNRNEQSGFYTLGKYASPLGAVHSAGYMYKACVGTGSQLPFHPMVILAMRQLTTDDNKRMVENTLDKILDAAGKCLFANKEARKATRTWLGVPDEIDDGRVMGAYISMIFQACSFDWEFKEFSEEKTVLEVKREQIDKFGAFPELITAYESYFNGMAKTLVNTQWVVKAETGEDTVLFTVVKAPYGIRRYKPGFEFEG